MTSTPSVTATQAALDVRGISISFGGLKAVQNFSISIPTRGVYGLIGPNGAGKTTCFNLLTGVYTPDSGDVILGGQRLNDLRPHQIAAAGLSRTFQNIRLFGDLTVLDNVKLACHLRGKHNIFSTILRTSGFVGQERAIEERAVEMLKIFNLDSRMHEQARNLPYGDQRRLEIARALATEPKVLLLDEPAAGMNPQEKISLRGLIEQIQSQFELAILLIEHDMGVVMNLCDHITVLNFGQTIASGTPDQVQQDPKVIEAYLGTE